MIKRKTEIQMPVHGQPFEHQKRAFEFACDKFGLADGVKKSPGVALLMEMGTGKTYVAIAVAGALLGKGLCHRVLIVAPLSLLSVWEEEFRKFADYSYDLTVIRGTGAKKKELLRTGKASALAVKVINYESAWRMEKELLQFRPDLIIADEAHKIKEGRTKQSKALHHLGDIAPFKLMLTGTMIVNREIDAWSQYRYLCSDVFGKSFYLFRCAYFDMSGYGGHVPVFREARREEFAGRLHSIAFRVTKAECLDLPEITEEVRPVVLEPAAMKIYRDIEKEQYAELADGEVSAPNVLTKLLRLMQITGGHLTDDDGSSRRVSSAKLEAMGDILDSAAEENRKVVIMAHFVAELDDLEALCEKKGLGYAAVRGGVKDRAGEVERFQNDPECRVFIGQIAAAGLGLTLTASSLMVFYSLDYSMANYDQAKARIHRVSQKNSCHYIYLIAAGTVDSRVLKALRDKVNLAKMIIDDYKNGKDPFKESEEING